MPMPNNLLRNDDSERSHKDRQKILTVITFQRFLLLAVVINLVTYPLVAYIPLFGGLLYLGGAVLAVYSIYMLGCEIKSPSTGTSYAVMAIIPCLGFFVLLAVNSMATTYLKDRNIEVGLFGADPNSV